MEVSGQLHVPSALPTGKSPSYPLDRRLGGPQSRSGCGSEEKNSQPPPEIEPEIPDRPAHSLVAIPTEISQCTVKHRDFTFTSSTRARYKDRVPMNQ
jgi:hypothetical protein